MPSGLIQIDTTNWCCRNCGETGNAEISVPDKCPKCGSTDLYVPLIKKGGPMDDELKKMKKY